MNKFETNDSLESEVDNILRGNRLEKNTGPAMVRCSLKGTVP